MASLPTPLPENAGLAFLGEARWPAAVITATQADGFARARNPAGRPNGDVLRSFVGQTKQRLREHWQIDFPAHYHEQEAALHEKPFARLGKNARTKSGPWWLNPHAQPPLRQALARLDRFLASALDSPAPAWTWFETDHLPDDTFLVVARDDEFTHAVLASAVFKAWWHEYARTCPPIRIIESFPFPWPPSTPLGALTKAQQEIRSQAARATLAGDSEQLNAAVITAYGWSGIFEEGEIRTRLRQLHQERCTR